MSKPTVDDVRERAEEHAESLQRSAADPTEAAAGRFLLWLIEVSVGSARDTYNQGIARFIDEESE